MAEERTKYQGIEDKLSQVEVLIRDIVPEKYAASTHPHKPWIIITRRDNDAKVLIIYPLVSVLAVYNEESSDLADIIADKYRRSISDIHVRKRFDQGKIHEH